MGDRLKDLSDGVCGRCLCMKVTAEVVVRGAFIGQDASSRGGNRSHRYEPGSSFVVCGRRLDSSNGMGASQAKETDLQTLLHDSMLRTSTAISDLREVS